jgi:hypothetical protein
MMKKKKDGEEEEGWRRRRRMEKKEGRTRKNKKQPTSENRFLYIHTYTVYIKEKPTGGHAIRPQIQSQQQDVLHCPHSSNTSTVFLVGVVGGVTGRRKRRKGQHHHRRRHHHHKSLTDSTHWVG